MAEKFIDGWYFHSSSSDPEMNSTSIHQGFLYSSRRSFQSYYLPSNVVSALIPLEVNTVYTLSVYADEYSWGPDSRPSIVLWQSDTIYDTRMPHDIWASPLVPGDPAYVVNSWPGETVYNLTNLPAWSGEWDYLNFRPRRYAVTFTTPAAMFNHRRIQLMFYDTRTSSTSRTLCTKIQLEKGSEATEWSLNNDELAIGGVQISKTGLNLTDTSLNIFSGTTRIGGLSKPVDGKLDLMINGRMSAKNGYAFYDTRAVTSYSQDIPSMALSLEFKNKTAVGNPPSSANDIYAHILNVAGWDTHGGSGGWPSQISVGNGLAVRQATGATNWGPWRNVLHSGNWSSYCAAANHSHYTLTGATYTKSITNHGYIELGPMNDGWAHIYTDRPAFYFNKELHVNGSKVWHAGNLSGSNRTIKKDITKTDGDANYDLFKKLNIYDYNLINDYDALDKESLKNRSRERSYIGLITDEVPDFLTDKDQEYIKLYNLASLTVSVLQKTIDKVEALESIIHESEETT